MKTPLLIISLALSAAFAANAASPADPQVRFDDVSVVPHGTEVAVSMTIDARSLRPGKDREYTLTPVLFSADGRDSLCLDPVTVAGHNLYYLHKRDGDVDPTTLYHAGKDIVIDYARRGATPVWLESARLDVDVQMRNCCTYTSLPDIPVGYLFRPRFTPVLDYGDPSLLHVTLGPKTREIDGRAYINFPVNRTELYPDYMNNPAELDSIIRTIDSVRQDADITVDSIFIKGFASPEGPYSNNVRLSLGRTATLTDYVERLYAFPKGFIRQSNEPEDWEGLRDYVERSNMLNRDAILEIIDSDLAPDPKNSALQRQFPVEYGMLLKQVYPWLRHSDYRIYYTIRTFTDPKQIIELTTTAPQKLSEEEVTYAISTLTPGSPECDALYETAVRMFPDNELFILGAANAAIARDDFKGAENYLSRAGSSPRAVYTRAVLAASRKDYAAARTLYQQAELMGVKQATEALAKLVNVGDGGLRFIRVDDNR